MPPTRVTYGLDPVTDIVEIHFGEIPKYLALALLGITLKIKGSNATYHCAFKGTYFNDGDVRDPFISVLQTARYDDIQSDPDIAWNCPSTGGVYSNAPGMPVPPDRIAYNATGNGTAATPMPYENAVLSYCKEVEVYGRSEGVTTGQTVAPTGGYEVDNPDYDEENPTDTEPEKIIQWRTGVRVKIVGSLPSDATKIDDEEFGAWEWATLPYFNATDESGRVGGGGEPPQPYGWGNVGNPHATDSPTEFFINSLPHPQWHRIHWKNAHTATSGVAAPTSAEGQYVKTGAPTFAVRSIPLEGSFCLVYNSPAIAADPGGSAVAGGWDGNNNVEIIVQNMAGGANMIEGTYPASSITLQLGEDENAITYAFYGHYANENSSQLYLIFERQEDTA